MAKATDSYTEHIHFDKAIEQAVLGSCFLERNAFGRIHGLLKRECFYAEGHQVVFDALQDMWHRNLPTDMLTIVPYLFRKGITTLDKWDIPGYLLKMTNAVVSTAHLEGHALLIREMWCEREIVRIRHTPGETSRSAMEKIGLLQKELQELTAIKVTFDWSDMGDVMMRVSQHMMEVEGRTLIGQPTGFSEVDTVTGGICNTNLTIIGARPSVGKSALLNTMAMAQARAGFEVGIISLEMPKVQIGARMLSLESGKEFYRIFRNKFPDKDEFNRVMDSMGRLNHLPIYISDKTGVNIDDIKAKAAQLLWKKKLKHLYIDYLQLIEGRGADENKKYNREQEVSTMSRGLKRMAMEFEIPVTALAQLNRGSEGTNSKIPQLHNLRESGAIEQDADNVMFLHRPWKSGIKTNEDGSSTELDAYLIIEKWRNGQLGNFKIGWDPPRMEFYDLHRPRIHDKYEPVRPGWSPVAEKD